MADCPHCGKKVIVRTYATYNAEAYGKSVNVRTECCGKPVWVIPKMTLSFEINPTKETHDGWGQPYGEFTGSAYGDIELQQIKVDFP